MGMGVVSNQIEQKLKAAFSPASLQIVDDSARHKGHAGAHENGESHFTVTVVSEAFKGLSRIERQRRINQILAEELAGPVHALSLKALTPEET
jgi:BolA protein